MPADHRFLDLPDPPELRLLPDDDRLLPELERAGEELRELEREPALLFLDFDELFDLSPLDFRSSVDFRVLLDFRVPSAFRCRLDAGVLLFFLSTCFVPSLVLLLPPLRVGWLLPVDFLSIRFPGVLGLYGVDLSSERRTVLPD